MKILQVHNFYQQAGGEDRVVAAEKALLTAHGHSVLEYCVHNEAVKDIPALALGIKTVWNRDSYRAIRRVISEKQIDMVHVHNTLPLVSPAVYYASAAEKKPVIQTLHNYRLLCPAATFYRRDKICELCLHRQIKFPAVTHACYRGNAAASAAVSTMLAVHGACGTYQEKIHTYIALTEFARAKFIEGGLPAERIVVKPNFVSDDPGVGTGNGGYALFAGRLTEEKGVAAMLDAWSACPQAMPLKIAGDGPLQALVRDRSTGKPGIEYLGRCDHPRLISLMQGAAFLLFPSRWYEGMPMAVLEAMACGTPVVAFDVGAMNDLIANGVNGIKLALQDKSALPAFAAETSGAEEPWKAWRAGARAHFEQNYTASVNYPLLLNIYQRAVNGSRSIS